MKETFSTFLPCFPGFYESPLYNSDMDYEDYLAMIEATCDEAFVPFSAPLLRYFFHKHRLGGKFDLAADFPAFMQDSAKAYCAEIARRLTDILCPGDDEIFIEFEKIISPKFYNFETDSVKCKIAFDADQAIKYCKKHYAAFTEYLIDNYKSRDGFISFKSHSPSDWLDRETWGSHEPGSLLQFILQNETADVEIYASERVQESVRYMDYFRMPEAVEAFLESPAGAEIDKEYRRLMKQGDDYLEAMEGGIEFQTKVRGAKEKAMESLLADMETAIIESVENE